MPKPVALPSPAVACVFACTSFAIVIPKASGTSLEAFVYPGLSAPVPGASFQFSDLTANPQIGNDGGPVINAAGDIALWSQIAPTAGGSQVESIWTYTDGGFDLVARVDTPAVGVPGGTLASAMSRRLMIDGSGNVAYGTLVNSPGSFNQNAIYVGGAAPTRLVVIEGQTVPQVDPQNPAFGYVFNNIGGGSSFLSPYNGDDFVFNNNHTAFGASLADPNGVGPAFSTSIYVETPQISTPNGLGLVVRNGTDTSFGPQSQATAIRMTGEPIFRTNVFPGGGNPGFGAIATFNGDISYLAMSGSDAGGDVTFTGLGGDPGINNAGRTAFSASFSGVDGSSNGLFKAVTPEGVIATQGIVAPGTPDLSGDGTPDFVFNAFGTKDVLINGRDRVAFVHSASTPDNSMTVRGIWSDRTGALDQLDLVVADGDQAPGMAPGTVFTNVAPTDIDSVALNGNDDIAFVAFFRRPDNSTGIGLWAERNGYLQKVAADRDMIELPDGSEFELRGISFMGGSGNQDGRPSGFSDDGRIVFRADSLNFVTSAYFIATLNLPGDANADGMVNLIDLDILGQNWLQTQVGFGGGDFNEDGLVNLLDLDILGQNWLEGTGSFESALAVSGLTIPEPGTALIAATFIFGSRVRRRRP